MSVRDQMGRRTVLKAGLAGAASFAGTAAAVPYAFAQTKTLTPVNIVTTLGVTNLVLNKMAISLGYLEDFGLQANFTGVADGAKAMAALVSGTCDIAVGTGFAQVLPAIERGASAKVLSAVTLNPLTAVMSAKPGITKLEDLVGKTVGTGSVGSLEYELMTAVFQAKGIDHTKVTFVNVGGSPDIFRAVVAGTVDAGPGTIDVYFQRDSYKVHALSDGLLWKEIPEFTNQATYATNSAMASKRDALVRTLAAFGKLLRYIQTPASKDSFIKAQLAAMGRADPAQALDQWNFIQQYKPFAGDIVISPERVDYMQKLNVAVGIQKTVLPFNQVADNSLAQDAVKLLG